MSSKLADAVVNIMEDEALRLVREAIDEGQDPIKILDACQQGMKIIGERFAKHEYFLPELIAGGELLKRVSDILKPRLESGKKVEGDGSSRGKIVLGTVKGDIHDIGKDIVGFMLEVNGFEVIDLGIDVPEAKFVAAVREKRPQVVALSGLLTLAWDSMKSAVEALERAGLRKNVKVMIGGGQTDAMISDYVRADGYGTDAMSAVRMAVEWTLAR